LINQVEEDPKYLLDSLEDGLAQELLVFTLSNKREEVESMKKAMIALGVVVVMFLGLSYVYAQDPGAGPWHRHGWMRGRESWGRWKRLNLTLEQKAKFKELRRKFKEENAELIRGLVAKRLELKLLWTDPKADSNAILAKEKELRELQNRVRDKIVQYRLEARSSLTPAQIEKFGWMGGTGFGFGHGFHHHYGCGFRHHHHHAWGLHHHHHHHHHHGQGMGRSRMWQ
jgi:Spy/CpxP family protein refolding chaperone